MDPSIPCVGERHTPLFHMNTGVLSFNLLLMFMAKVETASFIAIWLETENASCGNWYIVLNNLILGNCFAQIDHV